MTPEELERVLKINHDDQPGDIIDKLNVILATIGYRMVDDDLPHDGFCLYTLQPFVQSSRP